MKKFFALLIICFSLNSYGQFLDPISQALLKDGNIRNFLGVLSTEDLDIILEKDNLPYLRLRIEDVFRQSNKDDLNELSMGYSLGGLISSKFGLVLCVYDNSKPRNLVTYGKTQYTDYTDYGFACGNRDKSESDFIRLNWNGKSFLLDPQVY